LLFLFNKSIETNTFPQVFKVALVRPLHKGGSIHDYGNFRPISLLPAFSKIFEKIMTDQLHIHCTNYSILHDSQFGFRRGRSTEEAVLNLVNQIIHSMNNKKKALAVF